MKSYYHNIIAAIGGNNYSIRQFIAKVKTAHIPDNRKILDYFRCCDLQHLSLFIFRSRWFSWCSDKEKTWKALMQLADKESLSYVFYRMGENDYGDVEVYSNRHRLYFRKDILDLFGIQHTLKIRNMKLKRLLS